MPSNHLIPCHPLLLLPSVFLSIRFFSSESTLRIRWTTYWSFSFSVNPSNEYLGLISFRTAWFDLLSKGLPGIFSNKFRGKTNKHIVEETQFRKNVEIRMILGLGKWRFHYKTRKQLADREGKQMIQILVVFFNKAFISSLKYHKEILVVLKHLIVSIGRQLLDFIHQPAELFLFQKHRYHPQILWYSHL